MEGFQENIKKWVQLDTRIKKINDDVKNIRNEKNTLTELIMTFVNSNKLNSSTIKISDGKLRFTDVKQTAPITLRFLETCLLEIFGDEAKVNQIMNYIKDKREIKTINDIKRYYND
jgi:hypothetical protein